MATSHLRGHPIVETPAGWAYQDTGEPTAGNPRDCGYCLLADTPEGHDGCLRTLPGVRNACCGHGVEAEAWVQLDDGGRLRGEDALGFFRRHGAGPDRPALPFEAVKDGIHVLVSGPATFESIDPPLTFVSATAWRDGKLVSRAVRLDDYATAAEAWERLEADVRAANGGSMTEKPARQSATLYVALGLVLVALADAFADRPEWATWATIAGAVGVALLRVFRTNQPIRRRRKPKGPSGRLRPGPAPDPWQSERRGGATGEARG